MNIKGITISSKEIKKLSLFVYDATFLIDGSEPSFNALIKTIDEFSHNSGLKLNVKKSTILRAGCLRNTEIIYCKMKKITWTSIQASALGIIFTNNKASRPKLNFDHKLEELYACLNSWRKHKLSLLGKIMVIKTFALPKIIYPLTVLESPPDNILSNLNKQLYSFIWDGKPDKIARKSLKLEYDKIKRIIDEQNEGYWKIPKGTESVWW